MPSPSLSRLTTVRASTKRPPAVASGLRGDPATHLSPIYCTPLDPLQPEIRQILGLVGTAELLQTIVQGAPDIREGDLLVVAGREYPIRAVADWTWTVGADTTRLLVLEQPSAGKWADPGAAGNGIVVLTFADGYRSDASQAGYHMQRHGWAGTSLIVTSKIGSAARMTRDDVRQLVAWGWDVGSHGYTHDDPRAMTPAELSEHLVRSHDWIHNTADNAGDHIYAPPFDTNATVNAAALDTYTYILPAELGAFAVLPPGYTYTWQYGHDAIAMTTIEAAIDLLIGTPTRVLILCFHRIVPAGPIGNQASVARFKDTLAYIDAAGVRVLPLMSLL